MFKKYLVFIIFLSSISFAQTTIGSLSFGPKKEIKGEIVDKVVAIVGNEVITSQEILKRKLEQGEKNQSLESLIIRKLLLQSAKKENINTTKIPFNLMIKELAQATKTNPEQIKKTKTRKEIQENLAILRLQQAIVSDLVEISDQEINDLLEQQIKSKNVQVRIQDLFLKSSPTTPILEKDTKRLSMLLKEQSDQSIADKYHNIVITDLGWVNLANIPPKFSKALIDLTINQYSQPIVDNDGVHFLKILEKKGGNIDNKLTSKQTKVSHILVKPSPTAYQTINKLYQRLQQGENFENLAKQHSEDNISAIKGGNLGWVSTGQLVPDFTAVMDSSTIGEFSKPFQTNFGFHILKVTDRKEKKFSDKKSMERFVRNKIYARKAKTEWKIWIEKLRQESYVKILSP